MVFINIAIYISLGMILPPKKKDTNRPNMKCSSNIRGNYYIDPNDK